jgi:hypothetical protein
MSVREAAVFCSKEVSQILKVGIQSETDYHIIKEIRYSMEGLQYLESTPMVPRLKLEDDGGHEAIQSWL